MIADGKYTVRALSHRMTASGQGTPCIEVDLEFDDGQRLTWQGWLTEKTEQRTAESLAALGWRGDWPADDDPCWGAPNPLAGVGDSLAIAIVKGEEYRGEIRQRVQWINARTESRKDSGRASRMKAFAKQYVKKEDAPF